MDKINTKKALLGVFSEVIDTFLSAWILTTWNVRKVLTFRSIINFMILFLGNSIETLNQTLKISGHWTFSISITTGSFFSRLSVLVRYEKINDSTIQLWLTKLI